MLFNVGNMALTPAEKQRRYRERINANAEKREVYLKKMRDRAKTRRELKIEKSIEDLSERGKRQRRKEWRERQRKCREKGKAFLRNLAPVLDETPPSSPTGSVLANPVEHPNSVRGRKRLRRDRSAAYRRLKKLEEELQSTKRKLYKYKTRCQRLKKERAEKRKTKTKKSPLTKLNTEIKNQSLSEPVKRKLLFQSTLLDELREKYKYSQNEKFKQSVANIVHGKHVRKYKFVAEAKQQLGLWANGKKNTVQRLRCRKMFKEIRQFYCRDDNSIQTPGKKQTVTLKGIKKQKRLLTENLANLHKKFCMEFNSKVSFAVFCRLRPFWVVRAKLTDRDSCLCKTHDNLQKKLNTLVKEKAVERVDLETLCSKVNCNIESEMCMSNNCLVCKNKSAVDMTSTEGAKIVKWYSWKSRREEIMKGERKMEVTKTVKVEEEGRLQDLIEDFNKTVKHVFSKHVFRIKHQFKQLQKCKQELCYGEAAIHLDFSENYSCKLNSEIQAMHFGASHEQVTLHTVVVYFEDAEKKMFCTVSASRRHDPSAIWAHLQPILEELRRKGVDIIHFFSDGPASQYKNRDNVFFLKTHFHNLGFKYGTWNYSEAAHGKGAPDGVGAAIKRISDNLVAKGSDIKDATDLFTLVKERTSVEMYFIEEPQIELMDQKKLLFQIKKIPGIMKVHQIISKENENFVYTREYSCFCKKLPVVDHTCFDLKVVKIIDEECSKVMAEEEQMLKLEDWVVVSYEKNYYPGIVTEVGNAEYEVRALKQVGENKYIWPQIEDRIWYAEESILKKLDPPRNISKRLLQLQVNDWQFITSQKQLL